jgi:hypothetical protein
LDVAVTIPEEIFINAFIYWLLETLELEFKDTFEIDEVLTARGVASETEDG